MKHIVVTGANKGIGLAIVKRLLKEWQDVYVFLGSRDVGRGQAALDEIAAEQDAEARKRVELVQLDVLSDESVKRAVASVSKKLQGTELYGLVNNAGGAAKGMSARQVIDLNFYTVIRLSEAFLPLLQKDKGRIVQLSSGAAPGFLKKCCKEVQDLLANKPDVTVEDIEQDVVNPVLRYFEDSSMTEAEKESAKARYGNLDSQMLAPGYGLSKACVNAYNFGLSKKHPGLLLNGCSPGFISTDLTADYKHMGALPVEKGTIAPVHLLFGDIGDTSGWYFGSDAKRSPMHVDRSPGDPEYDGAYP